MINFFFLRINQSKNVRRLITDRSKHSKKGGQSKPMARGRPTKLLLVTHSKELLENNIFEANTNENKAKNTYQI
jgi:hypothetical protein